MRARQRLVVAAGLALALTLGARAAVEIPTNFWDHNVSGSWSATHTNNTANSVPGWSDVTGDNVGDVPDDTNLADGTNVTARFTSMTGGAITLDSNRTVGRLWHNWDGTGGGTASGSMTLNASGGSVLTLAREGATPQIHTGFRYTSGNVNIGMTINATLAGTQGVVLDGPATVSYTGYGLVLGTSNTISGTVAMNSIKSLVLKNTQAVQNATLQLGSGCTLRLRHDTDNATFVTVGLTHQAFDTPAVISVETNTSAGGTGHTLFLTGDYTMPGKTLSIVGNGGYRLEMTGNFSNSSATAAGTITADAANVRFSGARADIGPGLAIDGSLATGTNEIVGIIAGRGTLTKGTNVSHWLLSGENTYTGITTIAAGSLSLGAGGSMTSSAVIRVLGSGVFDVTRIPGFALVNGQRLEGDGRVAGNLSVPVGTKLAAGTNTVATLTVAGNVSVAGSWLSDANATAGTSDVVAIVGNLALGGGSQLVLATNGTFTAATTLTLATYSGTLTGTFGSVSNLPPKMRIDYGTGANSAIRLTGPLTATTVMFR